MEFWGSGIHPLIPSALRPKMKKRNLLLINTKNLRKGIHQPTPGMRFKK